MEANQTGQAGGGGREDGQAGVAERKTAEKSPGNKRCKRIPATSAMPIANRPSSALRTAVAPTNAYGTGTNPAARRACERETSAAKCGKSGLSNSSANKG